MPCGQLEWPDGARTWVQMSLNGYWLLAQSPAPPGHPSLVAPAMGRARLREALFPMALAGLEVVVALDQVARSS